MHGYPSRSEQRETLFYATAEKGNWFVENIVLYPAEIKKLKHEGFTISDVKPFTTSKALFSATVSWSHAYSNTIPHLVYSYINNIIDTYPQKYVSCFAQELFVIAHKSSKKK